MTLSPAAFLSDLHASDGIDAGASSASLLASYGDGDEREGLEHLADDGSALREPANLRPLLSRRLLDAYPHENPLGLTLPGRKSVLAPSQQRQQSARAARATTAAAAAAATAALPAARAQGIVPPCRSAVWIDAS